MSRNPFYTGNQTFTIPYKPEALLGPLVVAPIRGVSIKQDVANIGGSLPELMRPRTEGWGNNFLPVYVRPTTEKFDLEKVTKRRSQDKELK